MTFASVCILCNALRSGDFDMPLSNLPCFFTQSGLGVVCTVKNEVCKAH